MQRGESYGGLGEAELYQPWNTEQAMTASASTHTQDKASDF